MGDAHEAADEVMVSADGVMVLTGDALEESAQAGKE